MNEIQKCEFDALKDFARICEENGIDYMLFGGTVLGAVRHGGFIPWDDDIDICMTTPNYLKFLDIAQTALGEKYFVQNYLTESDYCELWTQIRINDTTSMPKNMAEWNIHWGIPIDIFPIVGLADDPKERAKQKRCFDWHRILLADKRSKALHEKVSWKLRLIYLIPRKIRRLLCKRMDRHIFIDPADCKDSAHVWWYLKEYPKETYEGYTNLSFEGLQFETMKNYELFLKINYGDYMQLPPENERTGHDLSLGKIIYDTKKSYMCYK